MICKDKGKPYEFTLNRVNISQIRVERPLKISDKLPPTLIYVHKITIKQWFLIHKKESVSKTVKEGRVIIIPHEVINFDQTSWSALTSRHGGRHAFN